jgi:hypothetical protein
MSGTAILPAPHCPAKEVPSIARQGTSHLLKKVMVTDNSAELASPLLYKPPLLYEQ